MQVIINSSHLKAASLFAASADIRYYLRGVFVEARPTETRIVATTGSIVGVLRDIVTSGAQDDMPDVIIPNDTVKLVLSMKVPCVALALNGAAWSLGGIPFVPVDGKFPDYRRILTNKCSGEAASFDPELMMVFVKAARALGFKSSPIFRNNGSDCAQVQFYDCDEFVGVIVPLNNFPVKRPDQGLIQWGPERAANTPPMPQVPK